MICYPNRHYGNEVVKARLFAETSESDNHAQPHAHPSPNISHAPHTDPSSAQHEQPAVAIFAHYRALTGEIWPQARIFGIVEVVASQATFR